MLLTEIIAPEASPRLRELLIDDARKVRDGVLSGAKNIRDAAYRLGSRIVRMVSLDWERIHKIASVATIVGFSVTLATIFGWFLLVL